MNIKKIDDTYKLFRLRFRQARKYSRIYRYYYHSDVDAKMVFIESRNGRDIAGNMLRILLEIRAQYGSEYRIITAARKESMETVKGIVSAYHLEDVKICEYESVEYFKYLWRAKYLFNDMSFPTCFIKKPEPGMYEYLAWHAAQDDGQMQRFGLRQNGKCPAQPAVLGLLRGAQYLLRRQNVRRI